MQDGKSDEGVQGVMKDDCSNVNRQTRGTGVKQARGAYEQEHGSCGAAAACARRDAAFQHPHPRVVTAAHTCP